MVPSGTSEDYRVVRPLYEDFAARAAALVKDLLRVEQIPIAQLEHRAKTVESFAAKVERKRYTNALTDVKDLSGVRVVTYYNDDVQRAADVIGAALTVSPEDSMDKLDDLDINEFGYRSLHVVCCIDEVRGRLGEWQAYAGLYVEIQIRSVLQHAWAAISHKLDYKSVTQAPADLRRQLFRLSALLELADEEFAKIRDISDRLEDDYAEGVPAGDLDFDINVHSLTAFLRDRAELKEWEQIGQAVGFLPPDPWPGEFEQKVPFLVDLFQALGLTTLVDIDLLLKSMKATAHEVLIGQVQPAAVKHGYEVEAYSLDVVLLITLANYGHSLPPGLSYPRYKPGFFAIMRDLLGVGDQPSAA